MKYLRLFLIICFISYIKGEYEISCSNTYDRENYKYIEFSPKSADDCKDRLSEDDKKEGEHCCYVYDSKKEDKGHCQKYDKYQYENIGKVIKIMKLNADIYEDAPNYDDDDDDDDDYYKYYNEYDEYSFDYDGKPHIDCYSQYMKLSLIGFLLILF